MKNIEMLFKKFVGVIHEAEETESKVETRETVVDDGQEVLQQDTTEVPGIESSPPEEVPLEDPNAMDEFAPPALPEMTDPNISETQKSINLLNLFLVLKQNVEKLQQTFEECDFTSVEGVNQREIGEAEEGVDELYHKLVVYITDNFPCETYEKSLYIYILLRNETLEITKIYNNLISKIKKSED